MSNFKAAYLMRVYIDGKEVQADVQVFDDPRLLVRHIHIQTYNYTPTKGACCVNCGAPAPKADGGCDYCGV